MRTRTFPILFVIFVTVSLTVGSALANDTTVFEPLNHRSALTAPILTVTTSETTVALSWTTVNTATSYTLFYAPYPYTCPETIESINMGTQTSISVNLWTGASFYIAVQAYNSEGSSGYSNIEYFIIGTPSTITPVYMTVVLHYEESFCTVKPSYIKEREKLRVLAEYLHENNIVLNLQSDWAFVKCVLDYDDELKSNTNNKNIIRYLKEDLKHEIDPHAHETQSYNIADVAFMISMTGVTPSSIVGGLIADPPKKSKYNYFLLPIQGKTFATYFWQAQWLWGDATANHVSDTFATGVWRPKSIDHFYENDDAAPLPCIGKYINNFDGLYDLIQKLENRDLPGGKIYTTTIFIAQEKVETFYYTFMNEMNYLNDLKNSGKVIFSSLSQITEVWNSTYNNVSNIYINTSPEVETPVFSLEKGTYTGAQVLEITCATPGVEIRYTFDKAEPNSESILYSEPIQLNSAVSIKAKAYKDEYIPSSVAKAIYIISAN